MVTTSTIIQALRARFVSEWTNGIPVTYDLQPDKARPIAPFVHFRVSRGNGGNLFGGSTMRGARVWLEVFVAPDKGENLAHQLLDEFERIFANWHCDIPEIDCEPAQSGPESVVNGLYRYTVSVPFTAVIPNSPDPQTP